MKYKQLNNLNADNDFCTKLLAEKGINDIEAYLKPTKEALHDYLLLDSIIEGSKCLIDHVKSNDKIFLQPDADCDGICSAAMIYLYIKHMNPNIEIDWRMHDGKQHGLILDTIPDDCKLIIAPDASSNEESFHKILKEQGKDILVIDHHLVNEDNYENNYAIIINNQLSENYPNKDLCGGGMVYKFCCCLDDLLNDNYADELIDLAAVSLIGDMMLLNDLETRYIVKTGIENVNNLGLESLIEKQSFSMGSKITPTSIAFYIVPLINSLIRVGTMDEKEALFKAFINPLEILPSTKRGHKPGDTETACAQAARICANAKSRQDRTKQKIMDDIDFKIQKDGINEHKVLFVEVDDDYNFDNNLTGLVAMGIASKYKKPTCIGRLGPDGFIKGSIRGLANCPIQDFRQFLLDSGLFDYVSGHAGAAGFSIYSGNLDSLMKYIDEKLENVDFNENVYDVDLIIDAANSNLKNIIYSLGRLSEIWGQGITEPLIAIENIQLNNKLVKSIGANGDTVKFEVDGITYIKFKDERALGDLLQYNTMNITVLGKANLNNWLGEITPQIMIEEYEIKDTTYDF